MCWLLRTGWPCRPCHQGFNECSPRFVRVPFTFPNLGGAGGAKGGISKLEGCMTNQSIPFINPIKTTQNSKSHIPVQPKPKLPSISYVERTLNSSTFNYICADPPPCTKKKSAYFILHTLSTFLYPAIATTLESRYSNSQRRTILPRYI